MPVAEPVRRTHFVPRATPSDLYAVVSDFDAYPRLFSEITSARVIERVGGRVRAEFRAQVVIPVRYVLDLVCDPERQTIDWTFVEGDVITDSHGSWRFSPEEGGTRIEYAASLDVKAPLPGFVLRKVTDALVSASLPAMMTSVAREVERRKTQP